MSIKLPSFRSVLIFTAGSRPISRESTRKDSQGKIIIIRVITTPLKVLFHSIRASGPPRTGRRTGLALA